MYGLSDDDLDIQARSRVFADELIPFEVEAELGDGLPDGVTEAHHRDIGYGVESAGDLGKSGEAVEKITLLEPDLALLDISMPHVNGLEAAREITNQHWMIQAPLSSTFHGRDIFSPAAAHLAAPDRNRRSSGRCDLSCGPAR